MAVAVVPPTPAGEVLHAALPWWTNNVMQEAEKLGIQHRASRCLREVWRHQDAVLWFTEGGVGAISKDDRPAAWLDGPEPEQSVLESLLEWATVLVGAYGAFYTWCDLSEIVPSAEDLPSWESVFETRKW